MPDPESEPSRHILETWIPNILMNNQSALVTPFSRQHALAIRKNESLPTMDEIRANYSRHQVRATIAHFGFVAACVHPTGPGMLRRFDTLTREFP